MSLQVTYRYEIYEPVTDVYLGKLKNVTSPFTTTETINTAAVQTLITVGKNPDTAPLNANAILDETGAVITDETGDPILEERQPDVVGNITPGTLIANDNTIRVYEFSQYWPSGKLVYKGYISRWKANYGGSGNILITCLTNGQDMNNTTTPGSSVDILDQQQTTISADPNEGWGIFESTTTGGYPQRVGENFVTGVGVTNIDAIEVSLGLFPQNQTVILDLYNSPQEMINNTAPLGSATAVIPANITVITKYIFPTPIPATALTSYFFSMSAPGNVLGIGPTVGGADSANADLYASGQVYIWRPGSGVPLRAQADDLYFKTYYSTNSTLKTYTDQDVSTGMWLDIMNYYISVGGLMKIPAGGYAISGVVTTYIFKLNTILEAIGKIFSLGPANWYWYGDMATEELKYQAANTVADHIMVKGRHINELDLEATKEGIVNVAYFSGGDDGTGHSTNIFTKVISTLSLIRDRIGLARLSDNRVSGADGVSTGQLIAQNNIAQNSGEVYSTMLIIMRGTYDVSLFKPGHMIGFSGLGNFIDSLLIQVSSVQKDPEKGVLSLGVVPIRNTAAVDSLNHTLADIQTLANPDVPS